MKISVLTLFPQMFDGPFSNSIIKRAIEKKILSIEYIDIRNFGIGKHKLVDDTPYGGGAGMLYRVDVLKYALDASRCSSKTVCSERVVLLDPKGTQFVQTKALRLSTFDHLIFICPHYEGVDQRFKKYVDEEISIGDFILTGGELPAMVVIDSLVRLIPGVLGKEESNKSESFEKTPKGILLEYPQYTKPDEFEGSKVPDILLSGDHKKIKLWREKEALRITKTKRPDLIG